MRKTTETTASSSIAALRNRPLLILALSFAAGDAAHAFAPHALGVAACAAAVGAALFAAGSARWKVAAAGLVLMGFAIGVLRSASYQALPVTDISHWAGPSPYVTVSGRVVSAPDMRHGVTTFVLHADLLVHRGKSSTVTGDTWVSVNADQVRGRTGVTRLTAAEPSVDYGDVITISGRLDTPQGATNPGGFSWKDYLARRAIACELRVRRPADIIHHGVGGNLYLRLAARGRQRLLNSLQAGLPRTSAALLSGILIGVRANLPLKLMEDFMHTGTVHILASAGLHVGVIACWLLSISRMFTLPRKLSAATIIVLLITFAILAGGRPSVTRAVIMACLYFGAILFEREPDLPTTFSAASLIILGMQPTALLESGFQLSFATVFTLIVAMPVWGICWGRLVTDRLSSKPFAKVSRWTGDMLGLSLIAQLGALPIAAYYSNEISYCSLLANLCVVPTLFVLIPLGFLGSMAWTIWHPAGTALLGLAGIGLNWVASVVQWFAAMPSAYRAVPTPSVVMIAVYYAVIFVVSGVVLARLAATEQPATADLQAQQSSLIGATA